MIAVVGCVNALAYLLDTERSGGAELALRIVRNEVSQVVVVFVDNPVEVIAHT